jgi:hypothetical protein
MKLFGVMIKPIVFVAVVIPAIIIGVVVFMNLRKEETPSPEETELTPARDLVGTWQGTASYTVNGECAVQHLVKLIVKTQTETKISGTLSYNFKKDTPSGCFDPDLGWSKPVTATAVISGSRLTKVNFGQFLTGLGVFSGSFTTDTITINKAGTHQFQGASYQLTAPINLLRQ